MPSSARHHRFLTGLITLVFFLRLVSQLAITPLGEGLDFYNHLSYVVFMAEQGRAPAPDEPSLPTWVDRLQYTLPAPDHTADGARYHAWAALSPVERARVRAALAADFTTTAYNRANGQSQHPPLYYWLLSRAYLAFPPGLDLEARAYMLALLSIVLAALALPGLYKTFRLYCDKTISGLALLALAWFPNSLPFLTRVTNDTLALPLIVWGLYFCLLARFSQKPGHLLAAGGLLILACFTKSYALTLLPLYLLCAVAGEQRLVWRKLLVAVLVVIGGAGALFAYNLSATGHLIPLTEMRWTAGLPWADRLLALLQVDPVWFVGGLIKGFWWLGFWSFVSPGLVYYLPLLALAYVFGTPPHDPAGRRDWLALRLLWPHYAALALFTAGMLWHAAQFTLAARISGTAVHSGNEGWYANVLLGSVFVIALVLLQRRLPRGWLPRVLSGVVMFFVAWSALGVAAILPYWGGAVGVPGRLRAAPWDQLIPALFDQQVWHTMLSLPGAMAPVALTSGLPLLLALAGTALALYHLRPPDRMMDPAPAGPPEALGMS